jgi:hypothetical protein
LRRRVEGKGDGVFALRHYQVGETILVGTIARRLTTNHSHATQVGRSAWVELGGLGPKVNHSCDPNCGIRTNGSGAPDLLARRPIVPGEEITFDYAMRNYSVEHFPPRCRCDASNCRVRVTGWKALPAQRKAKYRDLVSSYLLEIDLENAGVVGPGAPTSTGATTDVAQRLAEVTQVGAGPFDPPATVINLARVRSTPSSSPSPSARWGC